MHGEYFAHLKKVYKSKMKLKSKIKILESCSMSALSYGSQTWSHKKPNK